MIKFWKKKPPCSLTVEQELELIMAAIDDLNTATATLSTNAASLQQAATDLATRVAALKAGPNLQPAIDATNAAATAIGSVTTALGTLAT